jgi:hypothetical protein
VVSRERDSIGSFLGLFLYLLFLFFTGLFADEEIKITTEAEGGGGGRILRLSIIIQHANMIS